MAKRKELMLNETDLTALAREAFERSGLTQAEAAERLGVGQGVISRALRMHGRYQQVQQRIIREIAGWECEGPLWRVKPPVSAAKGA